MAMRSSSPSTGLPSGGRCSRAISHRPNSSRRPARTSRSPPTRAPATRSRAPSSKASPPWTGSDFCRNDTAGVRASRVGATPKPSTTTAWLVKTHSRFEIADWGGAFAHRRAARFARATLSRSSRHSGTLCSPTAARPLGAGLDIHDVQPDLDVFISRVGAVGLLPSLLADAAAAAARAAVRGAHERPHGGAAAAVRLSLR